MLKAHLSPGHTINNTLSCFLLNPHTASISDLFQIMQTSKELQYHYWTNTYSNITYKNYGCGHINFVLFYSNLLRAAVVIMVVPQLLKRNYKKLPYAGATLGLSIVPWLLSLLVVKVDALTVFLYQTVIFMGAMLGSGYKYYDLFPWWDRVLHLFSGIMFFGYGVSFAKMVPEVRLEAL